MKEVSFQAGNRSTVRELELYHSQKGVIDEARIRQALKNIDRTSPHQVKRIINTMGWDDKRDLSVFSDPGFYTQPHGGQKQTEEELAGFLEPALERMRASDEYKRYPEERGLGWAKVYLDTVQDAVGEFYMRQLARGVVRFLAGEPAPVTLNTLSDVVDCCVGKTIDASFKYHSREYGMPSEDIACVAVGGQARRTRLPLSDLDLLFIYEGEGRSQGVQIPGAQLSWTKMENSKYIKGIGEQTQTMLERYDLPYVDPFTIKLTDIDAELPMGGSRPTQLLMFILGARNLFGTGQTSQKLAATAEANRDRYKDPATVKTCLGARHSGFINASNLMEMDHIGGFSLKYCPGGERDIVMLNSLGILFSERPVTETSGDYLGGVKALAELPEGSPLNLRPAQVEVLMDSFNLFQSSNLLLQLRSLGGTSKVKPIAAADLEYLGRFHGLSPDQFYAGRLKPALDNVAGVWDAIEGRL